MLEAKTLTVINQSDSAYLLSHLRGTEEQKVTAGWLLQKPTQFRANADCVMSPYCIRIWAGQGFPNGENHLGPELWPGQVTLPA